MIFYCHYNPQLHDFVKNFRAWEFSSYHAILKNDSSFLAVRKVLDWFGGIDPFEKTHDGRYDTKETAKFIND